MRNINFSLSSKCKFQQLKEINPVVFRFELKTAAITPQDTPCPDCFFYSPKNNAMMKAACFLCFSTARLISLITLHSNTGRSDATRGSGFGRKCQTSV